MVTTIVDIPYYAKKDFGQFLFLLGNKYNVIIKPIEEYITGIFWWKQITYTIEVSSLKDKKNQLVAELIYEAAETGQYGIEFTEGRWIPEY